VPAVPAVSAIDRPVVRWCADGHHWTDHGDGTVSPSWGYGGTHMPIDDPLLCPEPAADTEHDDDDDGVYPAPACLLPAEGANAWSDRHLPFDDSAWCAWWVRKDGPWRLTFHQGSTSRLWASTYRCLDVLTGERFDVDRSWQGRRARLEEYPAHLREKWWTSPGGALIGCWSTEDKGKAGWLLDHRQVERWVKSAGKRGDAEAGMQLALEIDA
jgi:hypothetical protein